MPSNEPRPKTTLVLTIAIALSLNALLVTGQSPTTPQVDIERIDLVKAANAPDKPTVGKPIEVKVTLRNTGQAATGTLTVSFYWRTTDQYINQGPNDPVQRRLDSTFTIPPPTGIPPGGTYTNSVEWEPIQSQRGAGNIIVVVTTTASADGDEVASKQLKTLVQWASGEVVPEYENPERDENDQFPPPTEDCLLPPQVNREQCLIEPGQTVMFTATAHTLPASTFNDFWNPNVSDADSIPEGWNVTFSPATRIRSNATYFVSIGAPDLGHPNAMVEDQDGEGFNTRSDSVRFLIESDTNGNWVSEAVAAPHVKVKQVFKLNLTQKTERAYGLIDDVLLYNFTVGNDGNGLDDYSIRFRYDRSEVTSDWEPLFTIGTRSSRDIIDVEDVKPGKNESVQLSLVPPERTPTGVYPFDVEIRPNNSNDDDPDVRFLRFEAQVNQTYGISGYVNGTTILPRLPAETASFEIVLVNEGNGWDNVTLEGPEIESPEGAWTTRLSSSRVTLEPYGESRAWLNVTSGPYEPKGRFIEAWVNATSGGPPDTDFDERSKVPYHFRVDLQAGAHLVLESPGAGGTEFLDPGATRSYTITAKNLGNQWENATFALDRGNDLEWLATVAPSEIKDLKHRESQTLTVTLTAPTTGEVGDTGTVKLTVAPTATPSRAQTLAYTGRVTGPDLAVTSLSLDPARLYADQEATLTVHAGNVGRRATTQSVILRVTAVNGGNDHVLAEHTIQGLTAGQRVTLPVKVDATDLGLVGDTRFKAEMDPTTEEAPDGVVRELSESNNVRELNAFVNHLNLRVVGAEGLSANPGERVKYEQQPNVFVVENNGNAPEPVWVNVTSEHGWVTLREERTLAAGSVTLVPVTLDVPPLAGTAEDTLTFTVTAKNRPAYVRTASALTRLLDQDPPRILSFQASPEEADVTDPTNITARFEDALGIKSASVVITTPAGDTRTEAMRAAPEGSWYYEEVLDLVGTYRAHVEVRDLATPENANSNVEAPIEFSVRAASAPVIELGMDKERAVRSGSPVPLRITDPLGIGRVAYVLDGVEYEIGAPYGIDTTALDPGERRVHVLARNTYGVTSHANLTFRIDNEAPSRPTYTLDPAKPGAGEPVTVNVRTDRDVEKVTAILRLPGGAEERKDLERVGAGSFRLKFTPEKGEYNLDFVLQDEAGNARTETAAVAFTAKAGVPGLGLLGLLAGLGAAGLVRRSARREG